jgi:hypothetical protein
MDQTAGLQCSTSTSLMIVLQSPWLERKGIELESPGKHLQRLAGVCLVRLA